MRALLTSAPLQVMCQHVGLKLQGFEVVPFGSHSFIRATKADGRTEEYQLYGTGSWRPFGLSSLDNGIVAFVECVCQLEARLKEKFPRVSATAGFPPPRRRTCFSGGLFSERTASDHPERATNYILPRLMLPFPGTVLNMARSS